MRVKRFKEIEQIAKIRQLEPQEIHAMASHVFTDAEKAQCVLPISEGH